jgi:hypothetical protein
MGKALLLLDNSICWEKTHQWPSSKSKKEMAFRGPDKISLTSLLGKTVSYVYSDYSYI